jgi:IS30 family transposase
MRTYKRKRLGSRRGRMILAADLRARGMSLRQIAAKLEVHHDTIWRDLKRWDEENRKITKLSDRSVGKSPRTGSESDTESDSGEVVQLRRKAQ